MGASIYFKIAKDEKVSCIVKDTLKNGKEDTLGIFDLELDYVTPLQIALGCYEDLYDSIEIKESSDKYVTLIEKATHKVYQMEEDSIDVFLSELLDRSQDSKTEGYLETIDSLLNPITNIPITFSYYKRDELSNYLKGIYDLINEGINEDPILLTFALKELSDALLKGSKYKHGLKKLINSIDLKEIKKISKDYYNKFKGAKQYIEGM